jgi:hypothetical protein
MGDAIKFDPSIRKRVASRKEREAERFAYLRQEIDAAQQSFKSIQLINSGYCGAGLKDEIDSANSLGLHLANAGRALQGL